MPRREDIERFKSVLNSLGSEPEIRAGKAETIEEVAPSEEGLPSDIHELLGSFNEPIESLPPDADGTFSPDLGEGTPQADAGEEMPEAPEEEPSPPQAPPRTARQAAPPAEAESLDFDALLGEQGDIPSLEELEGTARRKRRPGRREKPAAREEPPAQEAALPALDSFEEPSFPEGDFAHAEPTATESGESAPPESAVADLAGMELVEPDAAEPGQPEAELAESAPGATAHGEETPSAEPAQSEEQIDFGNLDLTSFGEAEGTPASFGEAEEAPAAPVEPAAEPQPAEEFPSFESFDLGGEKPPAPEAVPEPAAEADAGEAMPGDFGLGEEPSPAAEEALTGAGDQLENLELGELDLPEESLTPGPAAGPARAGDTARPAVAKAAPPRGGAAGAGVGRLAGRLAGQAAARVAGTGAKARQALRGAAARIVPGLAGTEPGGASVEELIAAEAGPIELTPAQFEQLKRSLDSLPRNLKIVVQDVVAGSKGSEAQVSALIHLLVQGASAADIAAVAGRITGKKIRIPAGYEKKTGLAFEEERRTFGYAFRENIWPVIRLFVASALAVGLLSFLGYRFVYKPFAALSNYSRGMSHITAERYSLANERFSNAVSLWPRRNWFYRYAQAFASRRQFTLAQEKYDQLLARYPGDRKGILDYARLESKSLSNYEKADSLLARLLDKDIHDYDALLASGDNYLEWAAVDGERYEDARRAYASLIRTYGSQDELLFRMLRYFVRTDTLAEVERLRLYYAARPKVKVDPEAFAELGGYLTDKGASDRRHLDDVPNVLFRALAVRADLPEIHYNLARYYKLVDDPAEERKALADGVVPLLRGGDILTKRRMTMEIDTHTRLGELDYRQKAYLDSEKSFTRAIKLVEKHTAAGLIGPERIFGQPYAGLGDLQYYVQGNLREALENYGKAEANGYREPLLDYKVGYIGYAAGDWDTAIRRFLKAEDGLASPLPPANLLFAAGSAFYQKGDYFAAQGYYLRLLERLETRRAAIGSLQPDQQPEHKALLESVVKAENNLGVVMMRLSERTGDRRRRSQALVSFTRASETADVLSRVPDTLVRSEAKNLPFLNMRGVLYPLSGFDLQIYRQIPKDFEALFF
jgi:tetratricopeptide (TPR) repeat protein